VTRSIRGRLLLGLLALVAAVAVVAGAIAYRRVLGESSTLFDYQLRQMALSLRDQAASGALVLPAHPADSDFVIQIWNPLGQSLYHSRPGPPLLAVLGYADVTLNGERWRVYSALTPEAVIQVAQPWAVRQVLARSAALRVVIPLLLLLPLMALATTWIVGRGLAPLKRLAAEVQRRDVHSLTPIESPQLPEESRPLVEELNRLLARLSQAFDAQRAFVADAAHELRSPLTALSLQLQLLERAPDEAARSAARAKLAVAVERAIHLVGQLLTLARSEPEATALELAPTSLDAAVRDAISDVGTLAAARGIELTLDLAAPITVRGDADALRVLARNLIDNAVRYTPAGGTVQVRAAALQAGDAVLIVQDSGPGIPAEERSRAFDRFYRRAGAGEGGTGLGLAIVKAIADRHLARVALDQATPQGLIVTVAFPARSAS
jgi:two-component system OmpR family sensor kinase/two-component system sensor histidine kinase QseC